MPRYRRGRRYRKRYRRKGRGAYAPKFKAAMNVLGRLHGSRRFHQEKIRGTEPVQEGRCLYKCISEYGTPNNIEAILGKNTTEDSSTLGVVAVDDKMQYLIKNFKAIDHFRNSVSHPIYVSVYTLLAKKSENTSVGIETAREMAMQELVEGWKDDLGAGATGINSKTGENVIAASADDYCLTYAFHLKLKHSRLFMSHWKVIKHKAFKLNPGDDIYWITRLRDRTYDQQRDKQRLGTNEVIPGFTKVVMVKVFGGLGESQGSAGNVAHMECELIHENSTDCSVVPITTSGKHVAVAEVEHDDFKTDYEAATDHEMKLDHN